MKKRFFAVFLTGILVLSTLALSGCKKPAKEVDYGPIEFIEKVNVADLSQYDTNNPVVAMKIKDYGTIVVELYPDKAPNTVNSFISLVKSGFYDNNTIHRAQKNFVLQGGDPTGKGTGGPGYTIKGEFIKNGFKNTLKHTEGIISMARSNDMDSAGSQFFIMLGTAASLDGSYAAFGKVIEGMDVAHAIEKDAKSFSNTETYILTTPLTIVQMVVDCKGVDYPEPEKIKAEG